MGVRVVEPPEPLVTIDDVRGQILDLPEEDEAYVEGLILAAGQWIDGPAGWLGRAVGVQTLEWSGRIDCDRVRLPYPQVTGVLSVTTEDHDGNEIELETNQYRFSGGELIAARDTDWVRQPVHRIQYQTGYEELPAPIRVAVLMLVAHWYRTREAVTSNAVSEIPYGVDALLSPFRVYF